MSKKYLPTEATHERIADALEVLAGKDFGSVIIASAPAFYQRQDKPSVTKTTVTLEKFWVNIGNHGYIVDTVKTIDLTNADSWDDGEFATAANRAGKDFYIYACEPDTGGDMPELILSANSTIPTGYTAENSRKIGGFHCLCADVGTISGHTLSGYVAGDILPLSMWDLKHRAISENEGMVYIPEIGKWVDIYLASWDGSKLVSQYYGAIANGLRTPKFNGEKFVETFGFINKQLPRRDDFVVFAKGSNENTHIMGYIDPVTTGGNVDTNNRRMVSNYGLEDCCGLIMQWSSDILEAMSTTWDGSSPYMGGSYSWQSVPVYNSDIDSQQFGQCYGLLRRILLGGYNTSWSSSGSRTVMCNAFSSRGDIYCGGRGISGMR